VVNTLAELAVVMEQPPTALEFDDGVMRGPAEHRLQDAATVGEGSIRAVANGIAQIMGIAGRVTKVVLPVVLVHPRGLEEAAVMVVSGDGLPRLGCEDHDFAHILSELPHVVRQLGHARAQSVHALSRRLLRPLPLRVKDVVALLIALQLAAPQTAEVHVGLAVIVDENGWIDAVAALDRLRVRSEGTLRTVADGHTNSEDTLLVAGREVQIVLAVLKGGIRGPKLLGDPRDVLHLEDHAVISHGGSRVEGLSAKDVVVDHVVLVAIVVELDVGLAVVRGVDVDLAFEDVGGGVSCVDVGDEGSHGVN